MQITDNEVNWVEAMFAGTKYAVQGLKFRLSEFKMKCV